ncbi:MAG: cell wall metabolism sensor histidine kinase WalK, partial [Defluviitaleaceae bacterium]|nr:cell wall metabolism sensor histidine kinase WalK [Defluviitaleaceae bacterium]
MKSIRVKIVINVLVLVLIVMVSVGTFTVLRLRRSEEDNAFGILSSTAGRIASEIIQRFYTEGFQFFLTNHFRTAEFGDIFEYYILDSTGRVVAASFTGDVDTITQGRLNTFIVIDGINSGDSVFEPWVTFTNRHGHSVRGMQYVRRQVLGLDGEAYIIYLRMDAENILDGIDNILGMFLMGLLMAFVLAVFMGIVFASSINKPIRVLTNKAKEFARGELDMVADVHSRDEIGQLAESFNNMARDLKLTMAGHENEKNQKEVVLNNMTDGVLAFDNTGALIHANHVCRDLLGFNSAHLEKLNFMRFLQRLRIDEKSINRNDITEHLLEINGKYINAVFNHYQYRDALPDARTPHTALGVRAYALGGIVILLQDMTKHVHLDNMRKEFVANVSHELRTPLTTIKSYSETLLDEFSEKGGEENEHNIDFLKTIEGEADRMTLLVNDLLELSRMDNKQLEFNFTVFDFVELLRSNVTKHRMMLEKMQST